MAAGGKSKGPPPAVKKVLSLFGSGREEDKMVGYLSFLKIGPKLLKFLPGGLHAASRVEGGTGGSICDSGHPPFKTTSRAGCAARPVPHL